MPEKTARALDQEIETARREIAELQKRIRTMAVQRTRSKKIDYPQILKIDSQIANARDIAKAHPDKAEPLQAKINALETERYRLLLTLDEEQF